jgi:hypothetical protein
MTFRNRFGSEEVTAAHGVVFPQGLRGVAS